MKRKKQKKWIKKRHTIFKKIAYFFMRHYIKKKYGLEVEKFRGEKGKAYLFLSNHQTGFDQFFVDLAYSGPVYSVASEDIFSMGLFSKLLRFFVAPIPFKKSTQDVGAVKTCLRVAKEGGSIALFPEGNRTFSGRTGFIAPSVAKLAKAIKLPVAFLKIEGGYGVQPRWSDVVRKGKMRAFVSRVIEVDELTRLTADELYSVIVKELYSDECVSGGEFISDKRAEFLERAIYLCPKCGISELVSNGNEIECKRCGIKARYASDKTLSGVDCEFPFKTVGEWYDYQSEFMRSLRLSEQDGVIFSDGGAELYEVEFYKNKRLLKRDLTLKAYNDRFELSGTGFTRSLSFDGDVSAVSVLGKNKLNIYYDGNKRVFQIKAGKRFNALKYVNLYYHYKNEKEGNADGEFLGL